MAESADKKIPFDAGEISKAARAVFRPSWVLESPSLWPGIRRELAKRPGRRLDHDSTVFLKGARSFSIRAWAAAAALAVIASLALALFGLRSHGVRSERIASRIDAATGPGPRVEILSTAIEGSPAKAYLFQTPGVSYVWLLPAVVSEKAK